MFYRVGIGRSQRRVMEKIMRLLVAGLMLITAAQAALALNPAEQRGFTFVNANCSKCHAIGLHGGSPLPVAPPFRTLHLRYPVEDLAKSLAEGIVTSHPTMPQFRLDPAQVNDVIAYLKSLEKMAQ
jgi:mono/diheme cytochrome c family protein